MTLYDALAIASLAMALWLGWSYAPRTSQLQGTKWFNAVLARLAGPAVPLDAPRFAERLLAHPELPSSVDEDEATRALRSALSALPDPSARWARLFQPVQSPDLDFLRLYLGNDAFPSDPTADMSAALSVTLDRRAHLPWILFDGRPSDDLPDLLAAMSGERLPWGASTTPAQMREVVERVAPAAVDRIVLCASGLAVLPLITFLAENETLRDRVAAVVCVHGAFAGAPGAAPEHSPEAARDLMEARFTHASLDTEMDRRTPWLTLHWLPAAERWPRDDHGAPTAPAPAGLPIDGTRLPKPRDEDAVVRGLEIVDLGPVSTSAPLSAVALALRAIVTVWATDRCEIGAPLRGGRY